GRGGWRGRGCRLLGGLGGGRGSLGDGGRGAPRASASRPGEDDLRVVRALRRHARLFGLYFSQYAKARLEYRLDFFSSVFASFLGTAASFGFLLILFSRVPAVSGWSFDAMVFLYGFSLIPLRVFNLLSLHP